MNVKNKHVESKSINLDNGNMLSLIQHISKLLFPSVCLVCGEETGDNGPICRNCLKNTKLILDETWNTSHIDKARTIFQYDDPIRGIVINIKFHRDIVAARLLGRQIGLILKGHRISTGDVDFLLPVPTSRKHLKRRLFNQTEEMIRGMREVYPLPEQIRAVRVIQHHSQTELSLEERMNNVRNSFKILKPEKVRGRSILIYDDVYTTGATANELARILLEAGARNV